MKISKSHNPELFCQIYYFFGVADPKKPLPELIKTDYSKDGIRKFLLQKNKNVFKQVEALKTRVIKGELVMADSTLNRKIKEIKKADHNSPIILIKADEKAKYKNIVDIIDEMAICNIASYAIVDITPVELLKSNNSKSSYIKSFFCSSVLDIWEFTKGKSVIFLGEKIR